MMTEGPAGTSLLCCCLKSKGICIGIFENKDGTWICNRGVLCKIIFYLANLCFAPPFPHLEWHTAMAWVGEKVIEVTDQWVNFSVQDLPVPKQSFSFHQPLLDGTYVSNNTHRAGVACYFPHSFLQWESMQPMKFSSDLLCQSLSAKQYSYYTHLLELSRTFNAFTWVY